MFLKSGHSSVVERLVANEKVVGSSPIARSIFVMRKFLFLIPVLFLLSCATTAGYSKLLDSWMGSSADSLVSKWGPPSNVYVKDNGEKMLTFVRGGQVYMPGSQTTTGSIGPFGTINSTTYGSPGTMINLNCTTTFTISTENKVVDWSWRGNNCYAKP